MGRCDTKLQSAVRALAVRVVHLGATEAAWLDGQDEKTVERANNTLDRDRPSHGRDLPGLFHVMDQASASLVF
jgi:hypothetical protein